MLLGKFIADFSRADKVVDYYTQLWCYPGRLSGVKNGIIQCFTAAGGVQTGQVEPEGPVVEGQRDAW